MPTSQLKGRHHRHTVRAAAVLFTLFAGSGWAQQAAAPTAQPITEPEKLLFLSNHFDNVRQPVKLLYTYRKEAAAPDGFEDAVTVDVMQHNADGTASVSAHFLSGTREIPIPPIEHAQGNPVILGFLERDIAEMKRVTGGSTSYFRKRIRMALAGPAVPVSTVHVTYQGKPVDARQITIHPYADDPLRDRFGALADKGYVFIVSNAVPGNLYRVYTTVASAKSAPAIDTSLTVAQADPVAATRAGQLAMRP